MNDFITDLFYFVEDHLPEAPHDGSIELKLRATMTPEQIQLFETYRDAEFTREEADRKALFRFLLHVP